MPRFATPLRYPGGKQRLASFLADVIRASGCEGGHYVEPYAGGAGIAIELLLSGVVSAVHLNDLSRPVYSFWKAILTKTDEFCRRIKNASLTVEEWQRQRQVLRSRISSQMDLAFSFFYLNRCNRSGIPNGGLIGGLAQDGEWKMDARFPRNELIHRIEAIGAHRDSISVKNWDAAKYLVDYCGRLPTNSLIYCDPPYFQKADRLYLNHYQPEDHAEIAKIIQKLKRPWVVSYDSHSTIRKHYRSRRSFGYDLQYNVARVYRGREVFYFADNVTLPSSTSLGCISTALARVRKSPLKKKKPSPRSLPDRRTMR